MDGKRKILKATRKRNPSTTADNSTSRKGQVRPSGTADNSKLSPKKSSPNRPSSSRCDSKVNRSKSKRDSPIKKPLESGKTKHAVDKLVSGAVKTSSVSDKSVPHDFGLKLKKGTFKIPKKGNLLVKDDKVDNSPSKKVLNESTVSGSLHAVQSSKNVVMGGNSVSSSEFIPANLPSTSEVSTFEGMEWETTVQEIKNLWPKADSTLLDNVITTSTRDGSNRPGLEMDDMEVDASDFVDKLIFVADTNIWIHSLSYLRELLDTKFKFYSYPYLVIPWMVLQELDVTGKSRGGPSRGAINYIYKLLSTKHPRVTGQRASDACRGDPNFDRLVPDDSILQCVQQQQQKQGAIVVLVTNDRNMLNKALVNNILAVDSSCGVKSVLNVLGSQNAGSQNLGFNTPVDITSIPSNEALELNSSPTTTVWTGGKRQHSPEKMITEEKKNKFPFNIQPLSVVNTFPDALELFRQTISYIIEMKMKEEYGEDGWLRALKVPPPWTVKSSIQCILKHWIAVFTEVFGRRMTVAEKLLDLIKSRDAGLRSPTLEKEIINGALGLFAAGEFAMSPIVKTDSKVRSCVQALLAYSKTQQE